MRAMHATAIALSLTVALTGTALASDASVRAFHASPDAPAVDVLVNNALSPIAGLSYGNVSSYVDVPGATYNFKIVSAGVNAPTVFDGDLALAADTDYTIAATGLLGGSPAFAPIVLTDDNTLSATSARLRFVHASANAPAVDIALAGGDVLFSNISVRDNGGHLRPRPHVQPRSPPREHQHRRSALARHQRHQQSGLHRLGHRPCRRRVNSAERRHHGRRHSGPGLRGPLRRGGLGRKSSPPVNFAQFGNHLDSLLYTLRRGP